MPPSITLTRVALQLAHRPFRKTTKFSDTLSVAGEVTETSHQISFSLTQKAVITAIIKNKHRFNSRIDLILFGKHTIKKLNTFPLTLLHTARKPVSGQTDLKGFFYVVQIYE